MSNLDIHTLMRRFSALPNARIGYGPRHPTQPNAALKKEIAIFLDQYSFLRQDQGYIDFLECYSGASSYLNSVTRHIVIDIFGFIRDLSTHLTQDTDLGPIVDDEGYFDFAGGMVAIKEPTGSPRVAILLGAAFDATGDRKWGIYRSKSETPDHTGIYWYCETFLEWLNLVIETEGELPDVLG